VQQASLVYELTFLQIVEGAITMALGLLAFYFIPDFPDKNNFLSREQTALILQRIESDRGDSVPDKITVSKVLHHLGDWKLWVFGQFPLNGLDMHGCT
jgi:hypothetical protein